MTKQHTVINNPFEIIRGIPLDVRMVVDSLETLDQQLPKLNRYLGLIFYVSKTKQYYSFRTDINTPEPLISYLKTSFIYQYDGPVGIEMVPTLNGLPIENGQLVFLTNLGITVQKRYDNFSYFSGSYYIRNEVQWNLVPNQFKVPGTKVYILFDDSDPVEKQINNRYQLEDFRVESTAEPHANEILDNKIYIINGSKYLGYNKQLIPIEIKKYITTFNLQKQNYINHNLNTKHISATIFSNTHALEFAYEMRSENSIYFESMITGLEVTAVLTAL